jgi:thiamine biosynthesis protein ThiS
MLIKINGANSNVADDSTIQDLVDAKMIPAFSTVITLNRVIVHPDLWERTKLHHDDKLEVFLSLATGG